ncbi:cohesin complex subunit psm1 [Dimargaris cristalligena]|uniref:Structural maintenance of chromosomes protein n=1 Tax=Dimargaris cristalligena TaxID=215637 RepID=A0A4Q0A0J3_9FUNG|nr:cohesin complex subunit psm1 [Dimargaris cristalligena]|eukprot:RKP38630.1 cohesin complex subunit psm1 [Dimargaris cristalligena]
MGRLVELEVENFKSYKGRQRIGPFKSFTSIIGPNGAGKSNLMDAISFVLGVKSSQLRSAQLKELIYSIRSQNQPDGDDQVGESDGRLPRRGYVTAVYIDDEGKEFRFTRTVTSNGSSEYKINNKTVNYNQYNELLEKQNILIKARNFLVFQGDVEAVASQSASDLTKLIEQISGSWEYRAEYERLKDLQDLATETATLNNVKRRGIQSEIKEYQEQKAELDRFEQQTRKKNTLVVHHFLWRMYHVEKKIASLEKELDDNHQSVEQCHRRQTKEEEELKEAKREYARTYKEIMKIEKRLKQHDLEIEMEKPFLLGLDEKISHILKKIERSESNLNLVKRDEARQSASVATLEQELATVNKSAERFEATWREKMQRRGPVLDEHSLAEYRRLKEHTTMQTVQAQQELETLTRTHKTQSEETARLQERIEEFQTRKANIQENQRSLTDFIDKIDVQTSQIESELEQSNQALLRFQSEHERVQQTSIEANEKLTGVLNKLAQARVDRRESERETKMRDCLESLKRIFPGVYGRISDLCRPSQRKYDAAVAVALGRHMDAIAVDKQSTAVECIQYMKEQRAGQATFLPLDTISVKPVQEKYRSFMSGVRLAIDVLQFDSSLEKAIQFACGNTLICDSQKLAKTVVYDRKQEVKAVALDGTVIHKTGMITGGAQDQNASQNQQRWEEKELDNLKRAKDSLVNQLNDLAREKRKLHSAEQLQSRISGLTTRLQFAREERNTAARKLEGVERELEHVNNNLTHSSPRLAEMEARVEQLAAEITRVQHNIDQVHDHVFADFCSRIQVAHIRDYEEQQVKFSQESTELQLKFSNQQSKLRNQLMFEQQQLQGVRDRVQRLESALAESRATLQRHQEDKAQREAKLARVNSTIAEQQAEMERIKVTYDQQNQFVLDKKKTLQTSIKELSQLVGDSTAKESLVQKLHVERSSILRRCKLDEIALPLVRGSLANLSLEETESHPHGQLQTPQQRAAAKQRSSQWGIQVDFSSLNQREKANDSEDVGEKLHEQIQQITADLDRMAPNMHAHERLGGVEALLREAELEVDNSRRETKSVKDQFLAVKQKRYDAFNRAYSHMAEKIDQIYKNLTKSKTFPLGGTAYLSVEYGEEPYLKGVKYHAMPPMKRFRDMEQLSGGEKTVAALALLFAIHSYQPSPFFVLDEVDAALDNTNVAKVANYIRENCGENFQFIVISLKQALYENAQSLVGIYREQSINSSRTLTIDLEQYPE